MRIRPWRPALAVATTLMILAACSSAPEPPGGETGCAGHDIVCELGRTDHVGAVGRQQADGGHARRGVEHQEPRLQDQPDLHPPHRDGGEDRPGHRLGRGATDLMGMDLIYAPQFEKAQQLVDITDRIKDWPGRPPARGT